MNNPGTPPSAPPTNSATANPAPDERRREPRFSVTSGTLVAQAGAFECLDWSRTGFRVRGTPVPDSGPDDLPQPGEEFELTLRVGTAMGRIAVRGRGKIVRRTPDFIAGIWDLKDPSGPNAFLAQAILRAFMEGSAGEI